MQTVSIHTFFASTILPCTADSRDSYSSTSSWVLVNLSLLSLILLFWIFWIFGMFVWLVGTGEVLGGQASAVFLLPSAVQGRTAAKKDVWRGRHPNSTRVLQHLRARGPVLRQPYGSCGRTPLFEPSPTPILDGGLTANVLGRVPLMPLFLPGNSTVTLTIPHQLRQHQRGKFPHRLADAADALGKEGSNDHAFFFAQRI